LEYKQKHRPLKVRTLDGSVKTVMVRTQVTVIGYKPIDTQNCLFCMNFKN